jgi:hypothetical protein
MTQKGRDQWDAEHTRPARSEPGTATPGSVAAGRERFQNRDSGTRRRTDDRASK